jgi:hypothetical protein
MDRLVAARKLVTELVKIAERTRLPEESAGGIEDRVADRRRERFDSLRE